VTANCYAALVTDSCLLRNEDGLETVYEETIGTIQKDQPEIMKSTAQNYTITSTSKKKRGLEHNLQKHCLIHQLSNTKKETYNISTILNGCLSSEGTGCPIQ